MTHEAARSENALSVGAVALLHELLPTSQWYKSEKKKGQIVLWAVAAEEALPVIPPKPVAANYPSAEEADAAFDAWAATRITVQWTVKEREAVGRCVQFWLDAGSLTSTPPVALLIRLFGLDE